MYNKSLTKLPAREQAPEVRRRNFEEVSQGLRRSHGAGGSHPLHRLQEPRLHDRLPRGRAYPRFYPPRQGRRI